MKSPTLGGGVAPLRDTGADGSPVPRADTRTSSKNNRSGPPVVPWTAHSSSRSPSRASGSSAWVASSACVPAESANTCTVTACGAPPSRHSRPAPANATAARAGPPTRWRRGRGDPTPARAPAVPPARSPRAAPGAPRLPPPPPPGSTRIREVPVPSSNHPPSGSPRRMPNPVGPVVMASARGGPARAGTESRQPHRSAHGDGDGAQRPPGEQKGAPSERPLERQPGLDAN